MLLEMARAADAIVRMIPSAEDDAGVAPEPRNAIFPGPYRRDPFPIALRNECHGQREIVPSIAGKQLIFAIGGKGGVDLDVAIGFARRLQVLGPISRVEW